MVAKLSRAAPAPVAVTPTPKGVPPVKTPAKSTAQVTADYASQTDLVGLGGLLMQQQRDVQALTGRVDALERAVTALLKLSLNEQPVVAKVEAPVPPRRRVSPPPMNQTKTWAPGVEALPFLKNARLIKVFDSLIASGTHFNKEAHDAKLAQPSAAWLLEAANDYLDAYQGNDPFLRSVLRWTRDDRTVPQLRGVLGKMLSFYKSGKAS